MKKVKRQGRGRAEESKVREREARFNIINEWSSSSGASVGASASTTRILNIVIAADDTSQGRTILLILKAIIFIKLFFSSF